MFLLPQVICAFKQAGVPASARTRQREAGSDLSETSTNTNVQQGFGSCSVRRASDGPRVPPACSVCWTRSILFALLFAGRHLCLMLTREDATMQRSFTSNHAQPDFNKKKV